MESTNRMKDRFSPDINGRSKKMQEKSRDESPSQERTQILLSKGQEYKKKKEIQIQKNL